MKSDNAPARLTGTPADGVVFYTVREVAQLLRVSPMTVYRMCDTGQLDGKRVGRQVRIPAKTLYRYLSEDTTELHDAA